MDSDHSHASMISPPPSTPHDNPVSAALDAALAYHYEERCRERAQQPLSKHGEEGSTSAAAPPSSSSSSLPEPPPRGGCPAHGAALPSSAPPSAAPAQARQPAAAAARAESLAAASAPPGSLLLPPLGHAHPSAVAAGATAAATAAGAGPAAAGPADGGTGRSDAAAAAATAALSHPESGVVSGPKKVRGKGRFRGVSLTSKSKKAGSAAGAATAGAAPKQPRYQVCITNAPGHKYLYLGSFSTEEDAARRYDEVASQLNMPLNFPEEWPAVVPEKAAKPATAVAQAAADLQRRNRVSVVFTEERLGLSLQRGDPPGSLPFILSVSDPEAEEAAKKAAAAKEAAAQAATSAVAAAMAAAAAPTYAAATVAAYSAAYAAAAKATAAKEAPLPNSTQSASARYRPGPGDKVAAVNGLELCRQPKPLATLLHTLKTAGRPISITFLAKPSADGSAAGQQGVGSGGVAGNASSSSAGGGGGGGRRRVCAVPTSPYKGVTWNPDTYKWKATLTHMVQMPVPAAEAPAAEASAAEAPAAEAPAAEAPAAAETAAAAEAEAAADVEAEATAGAVANAAGGKVAGEGVGGGGGGSEGGSVVKKRKGKSIRTRQRERSRKVVKELGEFHSQKAAARKYDEAAVTMTGRWKYNFPEAAEKLKESLRLKAEKAKPGMVGSDQPRPTTDYVGVIWGVDFGKWSARTSAAGKTIYLGTFDSDEAAARRYDEEARKRGLPVNFPLPGTEEKRAEKKRQGTATSKFVGVNWDRRSSRWRVCINDGCSRSRSLGYFDDEVEAAKQYDKHAAPLGRPLNFPVAAVEGGAPLQAKAEKVKVSAYVGVLWVDGKWQARASAPAAYPPGGSGSDSSIGGGTGGSSSGGSKTVYLGRYESDVAAAKAYDAFSAPLGRPLNFPRDYDHLGTHFQQAVKDLSKGSTSQYVGVNWDVRSGKWRGYIAGPAATSNTKRDREEERGEWSESSSSSPMASPSGGDGGGGKRRAHGQSLGYFEKEMDAARKYDEVAAVLGRPLNFPGAGQEQAVKASKPGGPAFLPKRNSGGRGEGRKRYWQQLQPHEAFFSAEGADATTAAAAAAAASCGSSPAFHAHHASDDVFGSVPLHWS